MKDNHKNLNNLKIPYKFDSRYVFEDTLPRIFRVINDDKSLEELITNTKLPYVFSDDENPITFDYNLNEITAFDSYKEISYLISCKQIQTPIKINFYLTENTLDNTVLVIFEISIVKRELIPEKYKWNVISSFEEIAVDILNNIIIKLKNDNSDIYHFESRMLNYSRDKIVQAIFDIHEIMKEKGYISSLSRYGEKNKEGEVISTILLNEQTEIKLRLNKISLDENDVKWYISYMPLDISYKDYLLEFTIIKVSDNQTLLGVNNIYYEQIEPFVMRKLTEKKKYLFSTIEEELKKRYPSN